MTVCADSGKCDSGAEPGSVFVVMWDHVEAGVTSQTRVVTVTRVQIIV